MINPNVAEFNLPGINAKVRANTCGTAGVGSVYVQVNCEMSAKEADRLAATISEATEWLDQHKRDCKACDDRLICPESEVKKP